MDINRIRNGSYVLTGEILVLIYNKIGLPLINIANLGVNIRRIVHKLSTYYAACTCSRICTILIPELESPVATLLGICQGQVSLFVQGFSA